MAALLLAGGCDDGGGGGGARDAAATSDGAAGDARVADAALPPADAAVDAALPPADAAVDAGPGRDAGPPPDAASADGAIPDGAVPDATRTDAAPPDGAPADGAAPDAAPADAAPPDAAPADGATPDATLPDAAPPDAAPAECARDADCLGFRRCLEGVCAEPEPSPLAGVVVLNEILIDGAADEDANGDGDIDRTDDEFVELVNAGDAAADLSGWLLVETDLLGVPRHVFPEGTRLAPGEAIVVFGGGTPSEALEALPGVTFAVANAADPAFSNGLNLDDAGDVLRLLDAGWREVFTFAYGDACAACLPTLADRAYTRDPDVAGPFVPHPVTVFSPGTRLDGTSF